jgi:hypothetical protein
MTSLFSKGWVEIRREKINGVMRGELTRRANQSR